MGTGRSKRATSPGFISLQIFRPSCCSCDCGREAEMKVISHCMDIVVFERCRYQDPWGLVYLPLPMGSIYMETSHRSRDLVGIKHTLWVLVHEIGTMYHLKMVLSFCWV